MLKLIKVWQVGRLSYKNGLALQKYLVTLHQQNSQLANTLLCLEHPPVFTLGIRSKDYPQEVAKQLEALGIFVFL